MTSAKYSKRGRKKKQGVSCTNRSNMETAWSKNPGKDIEFEGVLDQFRQRLKVKTLKGAIEELNRMGHPDLSPMDINKIINRYNPMDPLRQSIVKTIESFMDPRGFNKKSKKSKRKRRRTKK